MPKMRRKIRPFQKAYALLQLEKRKYTIREIAKMCNISKSTVHRLWKNRKNIFLESGELKSKRKPGRKPKLGDRDKRKITRSIHRMRKDNVNFTTQSLLHDAGIDPSIAHRRTITRYLNKWGFYFMQSRKKGLLTEKDKMLRLKHARTMKRVLKEYPDYYKNHISFYLDGVSFVHKFNPMRDATKPKARVWRKKGEGLTITAKGSKELAGGRRLHLMVAIAYGKGVVLCEPYEKLNAQFFSGFIRDHFNLTFAKAGPKVNQSRIFVMDNDPSQTSVMSMHAIHNIEAELHHIPSRSQDLNPPENVFHAVKKKLDSEAIQLKIEHETFDHFKERVLSCFQSIDSSFIDKTIASLPKRIDYIIRLKGGRTKY